MKCTYKKKFPVDEFGRLGGLYSLADLPIAGYKIFERTGVIRVRDKSSKLYKIIDDENGMEYVVPFRNVKWIEEK